MQGRVTVALALLLAVPTAGCTPSMIVGPLSREQEEREHLVARARASGASTDEIEKVFPPLTPDERRLQEEQDGACRSEYLWKNGLRYTGHGLVAAAAALTIGGAYATGNSDETKTLFGVTGGTTLLFGTLLVAIGGLVENNYSDRGCTTRLDMK